MTDPARRRWTASGLVALALPSNTSPALAAATTETPAKGSSSSAAILRVPLVAAETGFDPARVGDIYSATVIAHIFEALYHYDPLATPARPRPLTAAALPEVSADARVWTVRLQRGIRFADDPAFGGRPRELVAEDYVYALKRFFDPATRSPGYASYAEEGLIGLDELRQRALAQRTPFAYDTAIDGVRALDRYTLRFESRFPRPRFLESVLCNSGGYVAIAREVVERYGEDVPAHPVGTGPYRLQRWRRSSRIVLERNPGFRELRYEAEPNADDAQGQAWLARFRGRRLPFNDGVEIVVLEEEQARWLAFLNGEIDLVRMPGSYAHQVVPSGRLAPNLAKRGIGMRRYVNADVIMSWFNMDDPQVGGYAPEKVALRRAIGLAYDLDREIRIVRRGQAVPAQAPMQPGTFGHDPTLRTENSLHDPARAQALLDLYGYRDRDGDGWREQPDGRPLELVMATQASQLERQLAENWQKSLAAVGLRIRFRVAQWSENMKAARAGSLAMWYLGATAQEPDAQSSLEWMYGPSAGSQNLARFRLPAFDRLYERIARLPDGDERRALFVEGAKFVAAYMPYRMHVHRLYTDLNQPWVTGYRQGLFRNECWQYIEVDAARRARETGR